jgi:hypothetical protein
MYREIIVKEGIKEMTRRKNDVFEIIDCISKEYREEGGVGRSRDFARYMLIILQ